MNDTFGWQIQKPVWRSLAAIACISLLGCGNSPQEAPQTQAEITSGIPENVKLASSPSSPQVRALIDESMQAFEQGNYPEAIKGYSSLLRQSWPDSVNERDVQALKAEILTLRGEAWLGRGFGFEEFAIRDFDDAIRNANDELKSNAYLLRAKAWEKLERWTQVASDCESSIRLFPNNGEAFLVRGRALEAQGKFSLAGVSFDEARGLGFDYNKRLKPPVPLLDQAKAALDAGRPKEARDFLNQEIVNGEDTWETHALLAQTQFQLQAFDLAVRAGKRVVQFNQKDSDIYRILGLSYLRLDRFNEAVTNLDIAIGLDPSMAEALEPALSKAMHLGGLAPKVRTEEVDRIRKSVATGSNINLIRGASEQWLLDLMGKGESSEQIEQLKSLMAETSADELDALGWLADFLMLRRNPVVQNLRDYLDGNSPEITAVEKQIWESVKSNNTAANSGVNVFPDMTAYAIEYGYLNLLRQSLDSETRRIKFDHLNQSIENQSSDALELMLLRVDLRDHEAAAILRTCLEKNRQDHAMLVVSNSPGSLTQEVIQFLGHHEYRQNVESN